MKAGMSAPAVLTPLANECMARDVIASGSNVTDSGAASSGEQDREPLDAVNEETFTIYDIWCATAVEPRGWLYRLWPVRIGPRRWAPTFGPCPRTLGGFRLLDYGTTPKWEPVKGVKVSRS